jgi:hypothetical protein
MPSAWRLRHFVALTTMGTLGAFIIRAAPLAQSAEDEGCLVAEVEYNILANVAIRNTVFGAANGVYPMGSGKLTLRIEHGAVKLMSYELVNRLTVRAKVAMLSTTVVTTSRTSTVSDGCSGSAQGTLRDGILTWSGRVSGYHSEGTQACSGSMCGSFGAPPLGESPLHDEPAAVTFNPFTFSADGSTFTMPYMLVSKSSSPRETSYLALSGRRIRQSCGAPTTVACSHGVTGAASSSSAHATLP